VILGFSVLSFMRFRTPDTRAATALPEVKEILTQIEGQSKGRSGGDSSTTADDTPRSPTMR
jgi:hypothetical protein